MNLHQRGGCGPGEPPLCPREPGSAWSSHSDGGRGFSNCSLLPSLEGCVTAVVLEEGLVLEAFCIDEFSPPCYIKFSDGEASASLALRGAVCLAGQVVTAGPQRLRVQQRWRCWKEGRGFRLLLRTVSRAVRWDHRSGAALSHPRQDISAWGLWMGTSGVTWGEGLVLVQQLMSAAWFQSQVELEQNRDPLSLQLLDRRLSCGDAQQVSDLQASSPVPGWCLSHWTNMLESL